MAHTGRAFLQRRRLRRGLLTLALLGALLAATVVDLTVGAAHLSLSDILPMLWPGSAPGNELHQVVFWSIRLPMTLTALVVGASLALAGLLMQTVLANPSPARIRWGSRPRRDLARRCRSSPDSAWVARWHWARRCWLR